VPSTKDQIPRTMGAKVLCFGVCVCARCFDVAEHQSKDYISQVERLFNAHKKVTLLEEELLSWHAI